MSKALVIQAHQEKHVIYCVREHLRSLDESARPAIVNWIDRLGLRPWFKITHTQITNLVTGSYFRFHGMSTVSEEDIKGWEGVTRCWVEEAHMMSVRSRELLYPTVFRDDASSQLFATFNPKNRYDPIYKDFVSGDFFQHDRYVKKINWYDNPWFPKVEDELRREFERTDPLRYAHIWEGMPDDASAARKILPYHMLRKCVQLWERRPTTRGAFSTAGSGRRRYRRRLECSGLALWPGTVQGRYVEGHGGMDVIRDGQARLPHCRGAWLPASGL